MLPRGIRRACQPRGDEDHEEQCVMKPTDRLRAHDAELDEQTQREVQQEQRSGNVE